MDKKNFIKRFHFCDENEILPIYDKISLAKKTNNTVYTSTFYTPNVWNTLENLREEIGLNICSCGIFEDAERKLIAFSKFDIRNYPIKLMEIKCKPKFVKLQHKDYLGALMALGLKREKFGDLILKEDKQCYLAVCEDISDYIEMNLNSVGKSSCKVNVLDISSAEIPLYNFKTSVLNVSSLRIDCLVSSLCNISRNKSQEMIKRGKVLLDYLPETRKDKSIEDNCIITVRGCGKFKIVGETGWTGSGRCKLLIKKFS
jgi:RNA-binding protein YlmH